MARHYRLSLRNGTESRWECGNVSDCFDSWDSGCVSPVLRSPLPMPNSKSGPKKTESPEPRHRRRSLGWRRGSLPAVWFTLPDVDCSRSQGPYSPPSSDTQERRILWRRAAARWKTDLSARNRQIQWRDLSGLSQTFERPHLSFWSARCDDRGQCQVSPRPASQILARIALA